LGLGGIGLGAVLFVLGLLGFPFSGTPTWTQKLYWSIVFLLVSSALSTIIGALDWLGTSVPKLATDIEESIGSLAIYAPVMQQFEIHFHHMGQPLKAWSDAMINSLETEYSNGFIDINIEKAPDLIAKSYDEDHDHKYYIAVNVGSTAFYFGTSTAATHYVDANINAYKKGEPVIRYYLFTQKKIILIKRKDTIVVAQHFADFVTNVKAISTDMSTVYSVAINVPSTDLLEDEARDFLWEDGNFIAETVLNPDSWMPQYARATALPEGETSSMDNQNFTKIREYLENLAAAIKPRCKQPTERITDNDRSVVIAMLDSDIKNNEKLLRWELEDHGYRNVHNKPLALCIYADVLRQSGVTAGPRSCS
jgi:hypothetical protein